MRGLGVSVDPPELAAADARGASGGSRPQKSGSSEKPISASARTTAPQLSSTTIASGTARSHATPATATPTATPKRTAQRKKSDKRVAAENEFGFEGTTEQPAAASPDSSSSPTVQSAASASITHTNPTTEKADPAQQEFGP